MPMYCLRSYLPLLLLPLPLSLSPIHLVLLLVLTYILNRPCIYCSLLLVILFASSCHWSDRCFFDFPRSATDEDAASTIAAWFTPRLYTVRPLTDRFASTNGTMIDDMGRFLVDTAQSTGFGLVGAMKDSTMGLVENMKQKAMAAATSTVAITTTATTSVAPSSSLGDGIGMQWLRDVIGRSEWTLPCVGVKLVL